MKSATAAARHTETTLYPRLKRDWQEWEAALLVEAGLKHQLIEAYFPATGERVQSFIYGFDLSCSQLLLDGLYPYPKVLLRHIEGDATEFWLQIKAQEAYYNLLVAVREQQGNFITLDVLEAGLTRNRRWEDRVYFPRKTAPKVEVQLPDKAIETAQLSNLSVGGAQILLFGTDAKSLLRKERKLHCRIKFNKEFVIETRADIRQCQFLRSPCCHSVLRLAFNDASPGLRSQLSSLIAAFHPRADF